MNTEFGLAHLWAQGDLITKGTAHLSISIRRPRASTVRNVRFQ